MTDEFNDYTGIDLDNHYVNPDLILGEVPRETIYKVGEATILMLTRNALLILDSPAADPEAKAMVIRDCEFHHIDILGIMEKTGTKTPERELTEDEEKLFKELYDRFTKADIMSKLTPKTKKLRINFERAKRKIKTVLIHPDSE